MGWGIAAALSLAESPAGGQATWDMDSLNQNVAPLQHALNGRQPLLTQDLPIPIDNSAVTLRNNGTLLSDINILWSKGIVPQVFLGLGLDPNNMGGAIATGLTLQDAGVPVNIMAYVLPTDFWPNGTANWFSYNSGSHPAFPLATPAGAYNRLSPLLQKLRAGDPANGLGAVTAVSGMWMDYEDEPQPWIAGPDPQLNGVLADGTSVSSLYDSTTVPFPGNGRSVKQVYGSDTLTGCCWPMPLGFDNYGFDLRTWLLDQSARKALADVYGASNPVFGNFGEFYSTPSTPMYDPNGVSYPFNHSPPPGNMAVPAAYADNYNLKYILGGSGQPPLNQTNVDDVYWHIILNVLSSSLQNSPPRRSVAWVSQYVRDDTSGLYDYQMTVPLYREVLRHVWLRGIVRMSVFNPHDYNAPPDKWYMTPDYSYHQLDYARGVMDEMLAFRSFLDNGTPMNFGVSPMFDHSPVWSGLALNGQAVVRTVSPNTTTTGTIASVTVPGGATFTNLAAPPDGATYLLGPNTAQHRVDVRPALMYLPMEQNYSDSTGNVGPGNVWKFPPDTPDPAFSTDVPGVSTLGGTYGLYTNQTNQHSLKVARDPRSNGGWGNGISVPNANGVFNTPSYTFETFIKINPGVGQDAAIIAMKEVNSVTGNFDWSLSYRSFAGEGMIELNMCKNSSTTYAWIRTSTLPLTPGTWHHLAFTFDGNALQAAVYVDGVAQPWGNHDGEISDSGVLNWAPIVHTGDQIVLAGGGLDAEIDEVRFTPEVLDPKQFLALGPLQ
jgi:hypothetical protein